MKIIELTDALRRRVVEISEQAGRAIKAIYEGGDFGTTFKEDHSPLTKADQAAHELIQGELIRISPDIPVISEESAVPPYEKRRGWSQCWLVDPLDGTKEFIKRNGEFTVNIALVRGGDPVLGVVHAPVLGMTYSGAQGLGAYKKANGGETRLFVSDYRKDGLIVVASRSHTNERLKAFLARLPDASMISMGSALKICLVAEGKANFYPRLSPTMEWDTAAAHCVVNEAGGSLATAEGGLLRYNREDMVNPEFVVCGAPPFAWRDYKELL
ncbi:MAG TPA: 3'(2'),5'-bisphosphate nucleotidase CysQ [Verrucomicrobiae bacterium]|nr:3'(2'),5'-bisphosphate nucleotidase CysQ [Verrucomicrobiae bacterium]